MNRPRASKKKRALSALPEAELRKQLESIAAAPSSRHARLVFSDWLQSRGHPWGSLIAVQHALATEKDKKRHLLLEREEAKLLEDDAGGLGKLAAEQDSFTWRWGFIEGATLQAHTGSEVVRALHSLLSAPSAGLLRDLILDVRPDSLTTHSDWDSSRENIIDPWEEPLAALESLPAHVSRVGFGASPPEPITAYVRMPDFGSVSNVLPHVRFLEIAGAARARTERFELPELLSLEVRFAEAGAEALAAILASELPKLRRLSVWLGGAAECLLDDIHGHEEDEDDDDDDHGYPSSFEPDDLEELDVHGVSSGAYRNHIADFITAIMPKGVTDLGLQSAVLDEVVCRALVSAPVVTQLERLDLSGGELGDDGAAVLASAKKTLSHLKEIDLRRTSISDKHAAQLKTALPSAIVEKKRARSPDFFFRYVATME